MDRADQAFLDAFEAQALPLSQWRHRDHVRLAYLYLSAFSFDEALERIRAGIKAHNASHGLPDLPTAGYHETLTRAWLTLTALVLTEYGPEPTSSAFCEAHPELMGKKVLRLFYSKARLMSPEAKVQFVDPDLAPLPRSVGGH